MIEFKAECGHSVRAKDSDAGKVVKCTYCGRPVEVPHPDAPGLEQLLLGEEAQQAAAGRPARPTRSRVGWMSPPTRLVKVLLGVTYLAVAVLVLAFGLKLLLQSAPWKARQSAAPLGAQPQLQPRRSARQPAVTNPYGECKELRLGQSGVVLRSVPSGASVYLSGEKGGELEAVPTRNEELLKGQTPLTLSNLRPGRYRVGFALPINARGLRDWPGYLQYRREVEEHNRRDVDYFLADDADGAGIDDPGNGPLQLFRTYPLVLRNKQWSVVIALFLPARPLREYLERLPDEVRFEFDEDSARAELDFYGVGAEEQPEVIEALRRIGKIVWTDAGGSARVFQIQPSGELWSLRVSRWPLGLGLGGSVDGPAR